MNRTNAERLAHKFGDDTKEWRGKSIEVYSELVNCLGAWAAGSATFLPYLADAVPGCVEAVTICADEDPAGQRGADELARSLLGRGFEIFVEGISNGSE